MDKILVIKKNITRFLLLLALSLCLAGAPNIAVEANETSTQKVMVPLSDDGEGGGFFVLLLLLSGPAYYFIIMKRYSGSGKRHAHERETQSTIDELYKDDVFLKHVKGASTKSIGQYRNTNEGQGDIFSKITAEVEKFN
jgi:hypothetical protein